MQPDAACESPLTDREPLRDFWLMVLLGVLHSACVRRSGLQGRQGKEGTGTVRPVHDCRCGADPLVAVAVGVEIRGFRWRRPAAAGRRRGLPGPERFEAGPARALSVRTRSAETADGGGHRAAAWHFDWAATLVAIIIAPRGAFAICQWAYTTEAGRVGPGGRGNWNLGTYHSDGRPRTGTPARAGHGGRGAASEDRS